MKLRYLIITVILIFIVSLATYYLTSQQRDKYNIEYLIQEIKSNSSASIELYSDDITNNSFILNIFTCGDQDISPHIGWRNIPAKAVSLIVLMYDPDAPKGFFVHWLVYNIPAKITEFPRGASPKRSSPTPPLVGVEGLNSYGKVGYAGPCPPRGERHNYILLVISLDTYLDLDEGATAEEVLTASVGHVISYGLLSFYYGR